MAKFLKKPVAIEAIRITQSLVIKTENGVLSGEPGDWMITTGVGEEYFVSHGAFLHSYEPANRAAEEYLEEVCKQFKMGF